MTSRRRDIAEAALRVLARAGSRGLTHRAVDVEAGLATGSVNYYFPTRDQLLGAALDALFEQDMAVARRRGSGRRPDDPVSGAVDDVVQVVRALAAPQARARLVARHELLVEAQRRPEFRQRFEQQRAAFVELAARSLSSLGIADPRLHADGLVVLIDGLTARQALLGQPRLKLVELEAIVRTYFDGVLRRA